MQLWLTHTWEDRTRIHLACSGPTMPTSSPYRVDAWTRGPDHIMVGEGSSSRMEPLLKSLALRTCSSMHRQDIHDRRWLSSPGGCLVECIETLEDFTPPHFQNSDTVCCPT